MPLYRCVVCASEFTTKKDVMEHGFALHVEEVPKGETITHGEDRGYYAHRRLGVPFPEDSGGVPCGCREGHNRAVKEWQWSWRRGAGFQIPGREKW